MAPAARFQYRSSETSPPPIPSIERKPVNPSAFLRFRPPAPQACPSTSRHKSTRPAGPSPVSSPTLCQVLSPVLFPALPAPSPAPRPATTPLPLQPDVPAAISFFLPCEFGIFHELHAHCKPPSPC